MNKKTKIFFLLVSLLALFLMGYDYVCGHMDENYLLPNKCPLCAAYQSLESGQILLVFLLLFGIPPLLGIIIPVVWFSFGFNYFAIPSLRAPPSLY